MLWALYNILECIKRQSDTTVSFGVWGQQYVSNIATVQEMEVTVVGGCGGPNSRLQKDASPEEILCVDNV